MEILKYGDSRLREVCSPVTEFNEELKQQVLDMFSIMYQSDGVGLAAPQVGILKRFFIADVGDGQRRVFINPRITASTEPIKCIEGCLSFPGVFIEVIRYKKLFVKAQDVDGKTFKVKATDLLAQAIQHEISHLDGILLPDFAIDQEVLDKQLRDTGLI